MTTVTRQVHFETKGRRKRAVRGPSVDEPTPRWRVPRISKLMALAIRYDQLLKDGVVGSQTEIAELAQVTQPRMTQIMNLLHLSPEIQEELLFLAEVGEGRDKVTEREVRGIVTLTDWASQRQLWSRAVLPAYQFGSLGGAGV